MKNFKKILAALVLVLFIFVPKVNAKIVTDKLPLLTFADATVSVYESPHGDKKGSIAAENSLVLVTKIQGDGWAYGSYKIANQKKRVYRWFKMEELQGYADFENYTDQVTTDTEVYRTRTSYSLVGKVPSNEDILVVAKRGDRTKIIFKDDGNYYRMGWVLNSSLKTGGGDSGNIYSDEIFTDTDEIFVDDSGDFDDEGEIILITE